MFINVLRNFNHQEIKDQLIQEISESQATSQFLNDENITVTDYHTKVDEKKYRDTFFNAVGPSIDKIRNLYFCKKWEIHNFWFQQYQKNDNHGWHTHGGCQWSLIYFVELPNKDISTEFYDTDAQQIIQPEVQEGDIIIFDSKAPHRSPKNTTDSRKTIISANLSLFDVDTTKLKNG